MKKRYGVLAAFLGLLGGYALALIPERERVSEPGKEYTSMPEEQLRILSYSTDTMTLTAQRSQPGAVFIVQVTFSDNRAAQRCTASPDLGGQLQSFTHLVTKRGLTMDQLEKEFPIQHGVLDLRNQMNPEPGGPYLVYTNEAGNAAALVSYGSAVELTIPLDAFKRLEGGCEKLEIPDRKT